MIVLAGAIGAYASAQLAATPKLSDFDAMALCSGLVVVIGLVGWLVAFNKEKN